METCSRRGFNTQDFSFTSALHIVSDPVIPKKFFQDCVLVIWRITSSLCFSVFQLIIHSTLKNNTLMFPKSCSQPRVCRGGLTRNGCSFCAACFSHFVWSKTNIRPSFGKFLGLNLSFRVSNDGLMSRTHLGSPDHHQTCLFLFSSKCQRRLMCRSNRHEIKLSKISVVFRLDESTLSRPNCKTKTCKSLFFFSFLKH